MDDDSENVPADSLIRYDLMVQEALRQVVKESLSLAASEGLPGEHHFYITFSTTHPGVEMPDNLRGQYPEEMTIVLQHQFWQLKVKDEVFVVTLSFSGVPQTLTIPYTAVSAFADPHVRFGLQFHLSEEEVESEASEQPRREDQAAASPADDGREDRNVDASKESGGDSPTVVSLDTFRRNR